MVGKAPDAIPSGLKVAAQMSPEPSEQDLEFVRQMGVEYVVLWTGGDKPSYDYYASRRELFENAGLRVYGFGNMNVHCNDALVLNLPNRDEKLEEYKAHLRNLGRAGIPYTTYAHMANGVWSTDAEATRGSAPARAFNLDTAPAAQPTHGRRYSEQEIWDNFAYFIGEAAPVAEEAGVKIGIHPDDPPLPELGGVPRCIFSTYDGYRRALEIADSPNVGVCFCCGCWLEGGDGMGKGILEAICELGAEGKIFKVHFRNVNQPLPHFVESFLDDGYMDMYDVMKALREVDVHGVAIPDHIPQMADDHRLGAAYTIGYMNALLDRAEKEVGAA